MKTRQGKVGKELAMVYALLMKEYEIPDGLAVEFLRWVNTSILLFKESKKLIREEE